MGVEGLEEIIDVPPLSAEEVEELDESSFEEGAVEESPGMDENDDEGNSEDR
jgi:hypothetical protein